MTIQQLCTTIEGQLFDRKSAKIEATALANHITAFANADGGVLAIGIEDNGTITGIDDYAKNINELLRAPFDFCQPSVHVEVETISCIDCNNKDNHIIVMTIPQSTEMHANNRDEVYYRVGDKSKKLTFDERLQLMYAKGARYFEDEPVADSSIDDLDMNFVAEYCEKIGYKKSVEEYIRQNKKFYVVHDGKEELSVAAVLLFAKNPQLYFPRARVRFIRYEGTEAKVGAEMNVIKDVVFSGRILEMVAKSIDFVKSQIKERKYLGSDGKFVTVEEYPEFVWKELIVNAITHRDYSIKGTDIQIKMFDDRLCVESPGTLPSIVRINNMREMHFSRNPKIAEFLHEYSYVQEFGEGVDRIYREMSDAGLPNPEYTLNSFLLTATIRNKIDNQVQRELDTEPDIEPDNSIALKSRILKEIKNDNCVSYANLVETMQVSRSTIMRCIKQLKEQGIIERIGSDRKGYWKIMK